MRDVFISHADEDAEIALAIARGLNGAGYSTWCYEDDSDPGPSYLSQIDEELETTQAVVLIISSSSLASGQVLKEVVRAHEAGKPFIPLRRGVPHEAVQQQRDWRMALGASVSIAMPDDGVDTIIPRVIKGLERSGVKPRDPSTVTPPPPKPSSRSGSDPPTSPSLLGNINQRIERITDRASDSTRLGVGTVIAVLGVVGSSSNLMRSLNPSGTEAYLYRLSPAIGKANVWSNGAALGLNIALLYSLWQLYKGQSTVRPRIKLIASLMLISIAVWFVTVISSAMSLRGDVKPSVIGGTITAALIAGIPALLVRYLFRR
jgi:hypothetical protein